MDLLINVRMRVTTSLQYVVNIVDTVVVNLATNIISPKIFVVIHQWLS